MDFEKTENVISDLEENAKKISAVTKSIEEFKKTIEQLDKLPGTIESKGSEYLDQIKDKHTSLASDLSAILKDLEKLQKSIPESIEKGVKKISDVSKVIDEFPNKLRDLEDANAAKVRDLQDNIRIQLDNIKLETQNELKEIKSEINKTNDNIEGKTKKLADSINWSIIVSIIIGGVVIYLLRSSF
jgi:gas vesicle protein